MIYNELYNFCKIRNKKGEDFSNRFKFIINLCKKYNIEYKIVKTFSNTWNRYFYNLYCFGSSNKFLSAHHDIVDINADNANDNSASIINAFAYKLKDPTINLIILDGEEPPYMGEGSKHASIYLKQNNISVKFILNLELTGVGNTFFIDNFDTNLSSSIQRIFDDVLITRTPFNDSVIFRNFGYNSNVITTVNLDENNDIDFSILYVSHSSADSVNNMSINDMKNFVNNVLEKIVKQS